MDTVRENLTKILTLMGIADPQISIDEEHKKVSIIVDDKAVYANLPVLLPAFEHLSSIIFKKHNLPPFILDINYYRKERERLIADLARAAAKKAMVTKSNVELPPMNSYERMLVHTEITLHPELTTESTGDGKERRVVIKRIS